MNNMTYQEKRSVAYLTSTLIVVVIYCIYVFYFNSERSLNPETDFKFYGITIILILPAMIIVNILTHIVFNVMHTMLTKEKGDHFEDELDKAIELRSNRNAYNTFLIGFLLSMISQALEMPPYVMFNLLVASFLSGSMVWSISHLYFYRKGF